MITLGNSKYNFIFVIIFSMVLVFIVGSISYAYAAVSLDASASTDAFKIQQGTTGERPTGENGMLRYNTTINKFEGYENGAWTNLGSNSSVPAGSIMSYASTTAPSGWLIADGSAISRTTYSDLFSIIGTMYGSGDGSTTFNIPNLSGRNIIGYGSATTTIDQIGETGGEDQHTLTVAEMPSHSHSITAWGSDSTFNTANRGNGGASSSFNTDSAGGDQPHNILDPYIVLVYMIKY